MSEIPDLNALNEIWNQGNKYFHAKDYHAALKEFYKILQVKPHDPGTLLHYSASFAYLNRMVEAEQVCHNLLIIAPKWSNGYDLMGSILSMTSRKKEAIEHYNKSLELNPLLYQTRVNLCGLYIEENQNTEALEYALPLLDIAPDKAMTYFALAGAYLALCDIDKAIECSRKGLSIEPGNDEMHSNLIFMMDLSGRYSMQELFEERKRWGEIHADPHYPKSPIDTALYGCYKELPYTPSGV